ncbi:HAD family acid phosphatase [Streptomyces longispororuber]|uniref:HAD family acid phosphatase n=1 Tax=Streptomyces longispororuber TaxID=68230 RepID=UPI00210D7829|nr:HAD family acid phosphatase [Streptomyces longispororuber]MCQ4208809.1 Secreted acid phosphatase [Streptomyces longispororuber]
MRKRHLAAATATVAALALSGLAVVGSADAGPTTGHSTAEPHNIGLLVKEIDSYYGATQDADGVWQASADSQYAQDLARVQAGARKQIAKAAKKYHGKGDRPAVVFDIDDTLLLSLDYEKKTNYVYNDASWKEYVNKADRPAVFGTPELIAYAESKGVEVFYNSGLGESQRAAAVENLKKVGIDVNLDAGHVFLKDKANPPAYLSSCATPAAWNCTTVQYKAGTRKHIESLGHDIVGNFGDQYSDLEGGHADRTYKFPNPTYYVS